MGADWVCCCEMEYDTKYELDEHQEDCNQAQVYIERENLITKYDKLCGDYEAALAILKERDKRAEAAEFQVGEYRDRIKHACSRLFGLKGESDEAASVRKWLSSSLEWVPTMPDTNDSCKDPTDDERRAAKEAQDRKFRPPDWTRSGRHG